MLLSIVDLVPDIIVDVTGILAMNGLQEMAKDLPKKAAKKAIKNLNLAASAIEAGNATNSLLQLHITTLAAQRLVNNHEYNYYLSVKE
jgi:hypothetical protein